MPLDSRLAKSKPPRPSRRPSRTGRLLVAARAGRQHLRTPLNDFQRRILETVRDGDSIALRSVLSDAPAGSADFLDEMGRSPLHFAAAAGNADIVRTLLDYGGADPTRADSRGTPALHLAAASQREEVLAVLREHGGCDPNVADARGHTALSLLRARLTLARQQLREDAQTSEDGRLTEERLDRLRHTILQLSALVDSLRLWCQSSQSSLADPSSSTAAAAAVVGDDVLDEAAPGRFTDVAALDSIAARLDAVRLQLDDSTSTGSSSSSSSSSAAANASTRAESAAVELDALIDVLSGLGLQ